MAYLPNHKWELFSRRCVELELAGDKQAAAKAYEEAGYLPNPHNARRLRNHPAVKARRQELFREACEYRSITAAGIVNRIDRVGRANIADLFEDDGRTLKSLKALPREISDAIESIEWVEDGTDESGKTRYRPKLKLFDKNAANFTLLKHFGGLPDPTPPAPKTNNILNVLSIDDQQVLLGLIEAFGGGAQAARGGDPVEPGDG
jgi:terminase small subunit-like protein